MGRTTPIRPVEPTRTCSSGRRNSRATIAVISSASFIPWLPVQALAFPELTTMAWATPFFTRVAQTFTGAAQTWFVVNIPATVAGASEVMRAKSGFLPLLDPLPVPRRLMSQNTPAARKPSGATIEPGMSVKVFFISQWDARGMNDNAPLPSESCRPKSYLKSDQTRGFRKATQEVHTLDGLTARAFDDVIEGTHHDQPSRAGIEAPCDFDHVGADNVFRVRQCFGIKHPHERFLCIGCLVTGVDLAREREHLGRVAEMPFRSKIKRGQDTAIDGNQMGGELNGHGRPGGSGEFLFHLRKMPVFGQAVRPHTLVTFHKQIVHLGLAPGATD